MVIVYPISGVIVIKDAFVARLWNYVDEIGMKERRAAGIIDRAILSQLEYPELTV